VNRLNDALAQSPRFDGDVYQHAIDFSRLKGQILRVYQLMRDGRWRTLEEIAHGTGDPVASVSSQLRHLRKPRHGGYTVNRRRRNGSGNLWEYQVEGEL
jgi:hypothetical protein